MGKKKTTAEFVAEAMAVHPGKYDYSLTEYTGAEGKVTIKCLSCGDVFLQRAASHTHGYGCGHCADIEAGNNKRRPISEWIELGMKTHPGKYDYSLVTDKNAHAHTKVKIVCLSCSRSFEQTLNSHVRGSGCPVCARKLTSESHRIPFEQWLQKAKNAHPGLYDYGLVNYVNTQVKVSIKCLTCGLIFEQSPTKHVDKKCGCPACGRRRTNNSRRVSLDEWILQAREAHPGKYDYSLIANWVGVTEKVFIKCLTCGLIFEQLPSKHVDKKQGCPSCAKKTRSDSHRMSQDEWLNLAREAHPGRYDYTKSVYISATDTVEIKCLTCGSIFWQQAYSHIRLRCGCPLCATSKGEQLVSDILDQFGVNIVRQMKFDGCKYKRCLPFDFYLPDHNVCIEVHGRQHYEPILHFGGEKSLKLTQKRDRIKQRYCERSNIKLEIIPYWMTENEVRTVVSRIAHVQLALF